VLRRIGVSVLALIAVVVIAMVVLLHSARVHRYLLVLAEQKAAAALGTQVQVRDFALHLSVATPTLDLYGVTVSGAAPYPNPPLLQAAHIGVGLRIVSLLRREWYLNYIQVDRPVARVSVDRHGTSNLPQPKSTGKNNTSVFDLGIRHVRLEGGEVYYNDRKSTLNADLHDLEVRAAFEPSPRQYSGTLGYREGHLQFGSYHPVAHNLEAQFSATPAALTVERAVVASGRSQVALTATLDNYAQPHLQARYDAVLDTAALRRILEQPSLPAGVVRLAGSLNYQSEPNRPLLDTVVLEGDLSSRALRIETPSFRGDLRDLAARYSIANGNAEVRDLRARLLGGELTGAMTVRNLSGASQSRLHAAVRGVSLADLKSRMSSPSFQQVGLTGTVNADADAAWGRTAANLVARADATIQARLAANTPGMTTTGAAPTVPLDGVIHALYNAAANQVSLTHSYVRTPNTSVTLNGTVSERSSLQVQMRSSDLRELETVADMFRTQPAPALGLAGSASFVGAVRGSTAAPLVSGQLTASNLHVKGSAFRLLRTAVAVSPSQVNLQNGVLQPAVRGRIAFNVRVGLRHWSFTNISPFQATLNASQVNIADLTKAAGVQTPVSGTLAADVAVRGSELNPVGQGTLSLTKASLAGQPVQSLKVDFQGTGDELHAHLAVQLPAAGGANATLTYFPKQQGYDAELRATGIRLEQLQAVKQRNIGLAGVLNLVASGRGTLKNPELQASLQIPQLSVRHQAISNINLQANVANHVANVALDSQVVNTYLRGRGTLNLTGNYDVNATLDTQAIPLAPLVAAYAPTQAGNITGQTELHATVRGPLKNNAQLEAHATIPTLALSYKNAIQLAAAGPIHIDYANGVLAFQRATIRGTDTGLQFQGTVPVAANAPVSLLLLGTVNLQLAQLMNPDITSSGQLRFDINSYGARSNPNVQGQIQIVNANVASAGLPIGLADGNGVLTLTRDRLDITSFTGTVGGGAMTARGSVVYRPSLQFDLAVSGKDMRLLYPEGVRETLDTNLILTGTTQAAELRGVVRLDQLQFTPGFDLMNVMGQFGGGTTPPSTQSFSDNLKLDVAVQSTSGINAVSRTLSLQAAANLRVAGTASQPVVLGRVNVSSGDMIFMGNRYVLQGGSVDFVNPMETQPVLNLAVETTIQQYNVHLRFEGPTDHLRTTYSSDPGLPPSDIINLLAFGKTTEASAANPTPGNLQAESAIASQVSSQVTSRVERIAGISQLSIDPVLGGNNQGENPGARITIQQRVTSNLFVTFGTDVTSTQRTVIEMQYKVTPRVTVSGTRDQNGGFGFDARIRKQW
jgi:translocation and assembly module TamB